MDLIDRAEVLYKFVEILPDPYSLDWYKQAKPEEVKDLVDELYSIVLNVNRIGAQPVKGKWIIYNLYARCSECSASYDFDTFQRLIPMDEKFPRHCSYCGAYMRGD